jgi:Uma2 family endonuclease
MKSKYSSSLHCRLIWENTKHNWEEAIALPKDSEPEPDIAIVQRLGREYREHRPYPENIFWLIEYSNSSLEKDLVVQWYSFIGNGGVS